MRILVMGAGAVGGYLGGLLARAGEEVVLIDRDEHLEALQRQGLKVLSPKGDFHVHSPAFRTPAEAGPADLIIVAVKSFDTEEAAKLLEPIVRPTTVLFSPQNGVENEEILAARFGAERVLGGSVRFAVARPSPGVVEHAAGYQLTLGELDGRVTERANRIAEVFRKTGLEVTVSPKIWQVLWEKLQWNAAVNAVCTLTGTVVEDAFREPETQALMVGIMQEVAAVAAAEGISLAPENVPDALERGSRLRAKPSMLQDREQGHRLEVDALNGVIVRRGKKHGIPTPFNEAVFALLSVIDRLGAR